MRGKFIATILCRVDVNGSVADYDIQLGIINPEEDSMYKVQRFAYLTLDESTEETPDISQCHKCKKYYEDEDDKALCPHCLTNQ